MDRLATIKRNRRIRASNYGRDGGWTMELAGATIAILVEPRWEETFWDSYRVEIVATDPTVLEAMRTDEFWATLVERGVVWRSKTFEDLVPHALPAGNGIDSPPFTRDGRLLMRGLSLVVPDPLPVRILRRIGSWLHRMLRLLGG
jgi:hypothetical protein